MAQPSTSPGMFPREHTDMDRDILNSTSIPSSTPPPAAAVLLPPLEDERHLRGPLTPPLEKNASRSLLGSAALQPRAVPSLLLASRPRVASSAAPPRARLRQLSAPASDSTPSCITPSGAPNGSYVPGIPQVVSFQSPTSYAAAADTSRAAPRSMKASFRNLQNVAPLENDATHPLLPASPLISPPTSPAYPASPLSPGAGGAKQALSPHYAGWTAEATDAKMAWIVRLWAATQLFGPFAMPAWIAVFATQWYTAVNLVPGEVALVVTVSKCIDVMTDPMMACYLRGCKMHTIATIAVVGAVIQGVALVGLFVPFVPIDPAGGNTRVLAQYGACYVLFFVGDTLQGTPVTTLGNMLKSQKILDEAKHTDGLRVGSMMKVVGILVMAGVFGAMSAVVGAMGIEMEEEDGVQAGLLPYTNLYTVGVCALLHILINIAFKIQLKPFPDSTISPHIVALQKAKGFLQQFSAMMTSSFNSCFFRQLIVAWICDQLTITLMRVLLMWFVRHKVKPELGKGCEAYEDDANVCLRSVGGLESRMPKAGWECVASNTAAAAVGALIIGAVVGNIWWEAKIRKERDRYGNRNMYHNWLMFNLSSAVTNGLMVFIGQGDTRLFLILCFVNGLALGGEFMTDTILIFLINSEVYQTRTDNAVKPEVEAELFESHTTKFAMMKTFVPKTVSLVAEALPLALIQIWYREPRDICREASPPIDDINSIECANFLFYNGTGAPKHIPQEPQVGDLIAFFFFVLPTVTCLLSYHIKSKFQVTDSGELVMLAGVRKGAPRIDAHKGAPNIDASAEPDDKPDEDCITEIQRRGMVRTLRELLEKLEHAPHGSWKRSASGDSLMSLTHNSQSFDKLSTAATAVVPVSRESLDAYVQYMQTIYEDPTLGMKSRVKASLKVRAAEIALCNVQQPKYQTDEWVGTLIPTTNERHLFKLPLYDHALSGIPLNVLRWATRSIPEGSRVELCRLRSSHADSERSAALKGVLHGATFPVYFPIKAAAEACYWLTKRAMRLRAPAVVALPKIRLFGVLGRSSVVPFGQKLAPLLASHIIAPGDLRRLPGVQADVLEWLAEARVRRDPHHMKQVLGATVGGAVMSWLAKSRKKSMMRLRQQQSTVSSQQELPEAKREKQLLNPNSNARLVFAGGPPPIERRAAVRIAYFRAGGIAFAAANVCWIAAAFATFGFGIISGAWSIAITVPMFLAAMGLVLYFFCTGLARSVTDRPGVGAGGAGDLCRTRVLDAPGLAALGVIHYNSYNRPGGKPLVFFSKGEPEDLLAGVSRDIRIEWDAPAGGGAGDFDDDPVLSYMVFVPAGAVAAAVCHLAPVHEVFDKVAEAANRGRPHGRGAVRWTVANIAPPEAYPQYRCFLYCWHGVDPLRQQSAAEERDMPADDALSARV